MGAGAPPLITLTSDFGLSDIYVGVMKGVILAIAPTIRLVDITHEIGPQNIVEASARLEAAVAHFPPGTIHLVVVDPGVGSDRAAVIVKTEESIYVAPDNGVLTLPLCVQPPYETVRITEAAKTFLRHPLSATFHGRDLFAPVAAHLATGVPTSRFGERIEPSLLTAFLPPRAERRSIGHGIEVSVPILYVDRFGNLVTALRPEDLVQQGPGAAGTPAACAGIEVQVGEWVWRGIVPTYAAVPEGDPLAYWGSAGRLEIAVRNGSAAQTMGAEPGQLVVVRLPPSTLDS